MQNKSSHSFVPLVLKLAISGLAVTSFAAPTFTPETQESRFLTTEDEALIKLAKEAGCPKEGTMINCMPPTTFLFCRTAVRKWVNDNCPNVSYAD